LLRRRVVLAAMDDEEFEESMRKVDLIGKHALGDGPTNGG